MDVQGAGDGTSYAWLYVNFLRQMAAHLFPRSLVFETCSEADARETNGKHSQIAELFRDVPSRENFVIKRSRAIS
jgi:hypothetical protein